MAKAATKNTGRARRAAPRRGHATSRASNSAGRASVRVYRHGLGDCILVRVKRAGGEDFKLMIDCGVVLGTENASQKMKAVADSVVQDTGGKVDALAVTHEHWDHVSGFKQSEDSFKKLSAEEVWLAWTENEDDKLAQQLKRELGKAADALRLSATRLSAAGDDATIALLDDIALTSFGAAGGPSTKDALEAAKKLGKTIAYWLPSKEPYEIPQANARIYFLGPPHDPKLIRKINPSKRTPETYGLALSEGGSLPFGVVSALMTGPDQMDGKPFHQRFSIPIKPARASFPLLKKYFEDEIWRRIDGDWLSASADLALALQSYTNNTSLVMALELGPAGKGDVLLFAGDAQVGNWESWQTLKWPEANLTVTGPDLLARTIFYKVGHHGSHNATLKAHGLEQMKRLEATIIPVDEVMAKKKRWGRMPLPDLVTALEKAVRRDAPKSEGVFLRTDVTPSGALPPNVTVTQEYFEIAF
jgi:Metallo-beta-lactamase superfamily